MEPRQGNAHQGGPALVNAPNHLARELEPHKLTVSNGFEARTLADDAVRRDRQVALGHGQLDRDVEAVVEAADVALDVGELSRDGFKPSAASQAASL